MLEAAERRVYHEPTLETKPVKRTGKKAKMAKGKLCVLAAIVTFFVFGVYYTSLSAVIASKGYELEQLEKDISRLETSNERMELTLASMSSLDKVEKIATQKLGMEKPDPDGKTLVASAQPADTEAKEKENPALKPSKSENALTAGNLYKALVSFLALRDAQASPSTK